jgi:hypothetical protein
MVELVAQHANLVPVAYLSRTHSTDHIQRIEE